MSIFSGHILKSLNDYKRLLRRYLSTTERGKAIINLGIKRKSLKFDSDVILYNKAHRVLKDIEYWSAKLNRVATEYSGIDEFYQYLSNYLSQYRVENNVIVHVNQRVSCALVQAIQIIALPHSELSDSNLLKLDDCIETVAQLGTKDQKTMLAKALRKSSADNRLNIYSPTLDNFIKNNIELPSSATTVEQ